MLCLPLGEARRCEGHPSCTPCAAGCCPGMALRISRRARGRKQNMFWRRDVKAANTAHAEGNKALAHDTRRRAVRELIMAPRHCRRRQNHRHEKHELRDNRLVAAGLKHTIFRNSERSINERVQHTKRTPPRHEYSEYSDKTGPLHPGQTIPCCRRGISQRSNGCVLSSPDSADCQFFFENDRQTVITEIARTWAVDVGADNEQRSHDG